MIFSVTLGSVSTSLYPTLMPIDAYICPIYSSYEICKMSLTSVSARCFPVQHKTLNTFKASAKG